MNIFDLRFTKHVVTLSRSMPAGKSPVKNIASFFFSGLLALGLVSCGVIPKNYPPHTPFVYEYNINIHGNLETDDRNELETKLANQLDDSIRVRTVRKLFSSGRINAPVLNRPPRYDSTNADKSVIFMRALLNSLGYFRDTITYDTTMDIVKDQYRTTVKFDVTPGKVTRMDSISFNLIDSNRFHRNQPELQALTMANINETFLKKGEPFAKGVVSVELDRLVNLFRDEGYYRFSRDELMGLWDTLDVSLLRPTFDPFEQLEILQKLRERRENPTANLEIRLRPGYDSSKLTKYYVGNITVYPEFSADTAFYSARRKEHWVDSIKIVSFRNLFKPRIFPRNIYFRRGDLYKQSNYFRTVNRFNYLGAWRITSIDQLPRRGQDTVDFNIKLTPALKYSFTANLEGSFNQNAANSLFGLGVNLGVQNRNFRRAANQSSTNIRYGVELGEGRLIQTQQFGFSQNIYFPRLMIPRKIVSGKTRENGRTILTFNASNTERFDLYNLSSLNASWGYEIARNRWILNVRYPNIEYSNLVPRAGLQQLFINNPSLRFIFTDGLIESINAGYTLSGGKARNLNYVRFNLEKSGLITSQIPGQFFDSNLYRFLKIDGEYTLKLQFRKSALAFRFFSGVGYEFISTVHPQKKFALPFFKQYFAGGPNSMRAWGLRKLGPGATVDSFKYNPERFGDVQLETNLEFRFPITKLGGADLNGALFTDIGNVWFLKKQAGTPEQVFNFNRLFHDLAIGVGAGLRIDFDFFIIRFDYSYKAKDPSPENIIAQNKWFYNWKPHKGKLQVSIGYPFIL